MEIDKWTDLPVGQISPDHRFNARMSVGHKSTIREVCADRTWW